MSEFLFQKSGCCAGEDSLHNKPFASDVFSTSKMGATVGPQGIK